jgi:Ca2+-binding RTX toxin-like protein
LIGNAANNVLNGNGGDDTIEGGDGADILFGGAGADDLNGGEGTDWVRFANATAGVSASLQSGTGTAGEASGDTYTDIENISGSAYDDTLTGDAFTANQIFGLDGDDILIGNGGHDFMLGGAGDDTLYGGTGRDVMRGNAGADYIDGGSEEDWIQFNDATGNIQLDLEQGIGQFGDAAGDTYVSIENVRGTNFNDVITGSSGRNQILAEDGNDIVYTTGGNDVVWGGGGDDTLVGSSAGETYYGGTGADQIRGGGGNDWARYNDAAEGVEVSLLATAGTAGEAAGDRLFDIEYLWGSEFDDVLEGDNGVNIIRGGAGDDQIIGRGANDILQGYDGIDTFVFYQNDGVDRINEFEIGTDGIRIISNAVDEFSELSVTNFNGSAAIGYDPGDSILLVGIDASQVQAGWFTFG